MAAGFHHNCKVFRQYFLRHIADAQQQQLWVASATQQEFSSRRVMPSGMKVDWFSDNKNTSSPRVMRAVPLTTIQCPARWWCICRDQMPPSSPAPARFSENKSRTDIASATWQSRAMGGQGCGCAKSNAATRFLKTLDT